MRLLNLIIKKIETVSSFRPIGVQLDGKLNFSLHFSNICKSAVNQLSALMRLHSFLFFEGKSYYQ